MAKKSFKLPHTLVLIYLLVILVYVLALVLPSGEFDRAEKTVQGQTRLVTVPAPIIR
jgi:C4-dicarboxylate anaerobic carrier.